MSDQQEKVLGDNAGVYIPSEDSANRNISIDFGGFIVGLYQSALMSLGKLQLPDIAQSVDIESARHTIDILRLLQQKTKGNLDEEESRLLSGFIQELQLIYVEVSQ